MRNVAVPFGVYELVEFAAVGLRHAFAARQDVDLTCKRGTVRVIRLSCIPSTHVCQLASLSSMNYLCRVCVGEGEQC